MVKKEKALKEQKYNCRILFAFAFLVVFLTLSFGVLFNVSRENILSIGHLNSVQLAQELKYYLIEEIDEISLAARTVEIMQENHKSDEEILDYLTFESGLVSQVINENYTGIYGYINGTYMDGSGWSPEADYDPKTRPWYTGALEAKGNATYVTPYEDAETGNLMISVCKLLADGESVISLDVSLDRIQDIVSSYALTDYDQVIITDRRFNVVGVRDTSLLGLNISSDPMIKAFLSSDAQISPNGYFEYRKVTGEKASVFASAVEDQWVVFLIIRSSRMMRSLCYIYLILFAGSAAFIVFGLLTFDYLNKRRKAAEDLNMQLESLADIYVSVHRIDIDSDTFTEIRSLPNVSRRVQSAMQKAAGAHEVLERVLKATVRDEYWADMKAFIDYDTLDSRLKDTNTITLEFLGTNGWYKARIVVLERKNGHITSFLWIVVYIDKEKRMQNELLYLSETDLMTGIRNRGSGEKAIKEQLKQGTAGMFCLMDGDKFKSINDTYGHEAGDQVIREIATCMRKTFRVSDIVLRLGGDEFAAFAPGIERPDQAELVLKRLILAIDAVNIPALKDERKIELSIGVSFAPSGTVKNFEELYHEADTAAYQSKKITGSFVTYYNKSMDE